ncbi:hypothetical protein NC651_033711 [Populus alba x Populus x berolinensis]|nr:hypothetical protein NC651_033711 [Populus alba x Populus x berolinensis]
MRKGHLTELPKMNQTLLQLRDERTSIDMTELVRSGLGLVGFRFLGATQATQTFNTYDYTMDAFESNVFE